MRQETRLLQTAEVAPAQRIGFWTQALAQVCDGLQTDGYGANTLDGRIKLATIGRLKLCDIAASRHRTMRTIEQETSPKSAIKIVCQLNGISVYQQNGAEIVVRPGDWIVYDVSRPHAVINTDSGSHLVVTVPKDLALLNDIRFTKTPRLHPANETCLGRPAMNFIRSTIDDEIEPECEEDATDAILHLLRLSLRNEQKFDSRLTSKMALNQEIKRLIHDNLRDPEFGIAQMANALGCSKRLLHRSFAEEGMTITGYLWACRLDKCRSDLGSPRLDTDTVTKIAFSWGFSSSSHFSRSFRTRFGVAPSTLARKTT